MYDDPTPRWMGACYIGVASSVASGGVGRNNASSALSCGPSTRDHEYARGGTRSLRPRPGRQDATNGRALPCASGRRPRKRPLAGPDLARRRRPARPTARRCGRSGRIAALYLSGRFGRDRPLQRPGRAAADRRATATVGGGTCRRVGRRRRPAALRRRRRHARLHRRRSRLADGLATRRHHPRRLRREVRRRRRHGATVRPTLRARITRNCDGKI